MTFRVIRFGLVLLFSATGTGLCHADCAALYALAQRHAYDMARRNSLEPPNVRFWGPDLSQCPFVTQGGHPKKDSGHWSTAIPNSAKPGKGRRVLVA